LLHASVISFYEKCTAFKQECPVAPAKGQQKPGIPLSIDLHSNARLMKGLCINLSKTKSLTELTLCGISLSKDSITDLSNGLFLASSLKILRINFCVQKRSTLLKLMPALSNPSVVPLEELSLMANGLTDSDMGELVSKIIVGHCEARDIIEWKYGLRDEQAPADELVGLKSLDLSFNKLGE
jgi:Leucine-rich repeat (LRR) protein